MRKQTNSVVKRSTGRAALLTSAAALAVITATPALAQTVHLKEGETVQGDVSLAGNTRLIVDISRINADTAELNLGENEGRPKLLTGSLTGSAGDDWLWLRADTSQVRDVVYTRVGNTSIEQYAHAGAYEFRRGITYEASGNSTELTLQNKARGPVGHALKFQPLSFAGDGTIIVDFTLQADQDGATPDVAIVTQQIDAITGDGLLDVIIKGSVDGNAGLNAQGELDPDIGLIDVRKGASSLTFATGSSVTAGHNTLVLGGDTDIVIERGATLMLKSDADGSHPGRIIRSSGSVVNAGKIDATSNGDSPTTPTLLGDRGVGLYLEGANFNNTLDERGTTIGEVLGGQYGVLAASGDNLVTNVGLIRSVNGAAIATESGSMIFRNGVYTFANGTTRTGVVEGGGINGAKVAYQDLDISQDLIVNSGSIIGDVLMDDGSDTFLYTGATNGVTGRIDGGHSARDAYGVSVSTSRTVTFADDLNTNTSTSTITGFEMHGLELNGQGLNVTIEAAGAGLADGIKILGAGTVTNKANIADADADSVGLFVEHFERLDSGIDLINSADVSADYAAVFQTGIRSFRNSGDIVGREGGALFEIGQADASLGPVTFFNEGTITGGRSYGALVFSMESINGVSADAVLAVVDNAGTLNGSAEAPDPTRDDAVATVRLGVQGEGRITFNNSGSVAASGKGGLGLQTYGSSFGLHNSGTIAASGAAAGGVLLTAIENPDETLLFTNASTGTIRSNGGGITVGTRRAFAFGLGATGISGGSVAIDNAGLIEATEPGSIAVAAVGVGSAEDNTFTLKNSGTIHGGADAVLAVGQQASDQTLGLGDVLNDTLTRRTVAGGIQTYNTTDLVQNSSTGRIIGNVDLHLGDDRFENFGVLDGSVQLSDGDDTYVFGAGSTLTGSAIGGVGDDLILADLSTSSDIVINGAQFRQFERIERLSGELGTGKLFLEGTFDNRLNIRDLTVYIAEGKKLETFQSFSLNGSELSETVYNAGTITEGVSLGAGDDHLFNSGDLENNSTHMGDGDDEIVNSSTGSLRDVYAGAGEDRLTSSGRIFSVEMDDGDDVFDNSGLVETDVLLGEGNDTYYARSGSSVGGFIDGGAGEDDTIIYALADGGGSPQNAIHFESLGAYGKGVLELSLAQGQHWNTIRLLEEASLNLQLQGGSVDAIEGDDSSQSVKIDGVFTGSVDLMGGDDTLELSLSGLLAGDLDGGEGDDLLKLNLTGASSINGLFGFENVAVTGSSPLTLTGTLDAASGITFDGGANEFIIAENAVFNGKADGGEGQDKLRIATGGTASRTIVTGQITSFEDVFA
ncbi:MAG: hypothetical protein EON90_15080, partial [Brevundimonas sp.]